MKITTNTKFLATLIGMVAFISSAQATITQAACLKLAKDYASNNGPFIAHSCAIAQRSAGSDDKRKNAEFYADGSNGYLGFYCADDAIGMCNIDGNATVSSAMCNSSNNTIIQFTMTTTSGNKGSIVIKPKTSISGSYEAQSSDAEPSKCEGSYSKF